jgi:hypothetical protein
MFMIFESKLSGEVSYCDIGAENRSSPAVSGITARRLKCSG